MKSGIRIRDGLDYIPCTDIRPGWTMVFKRPQHNNPNRGPFPKELLERHFVLKRLVQDGEQLLIPSKVVTLSNPHSNQWWAAPPDCLESEQVFVFANLIPLKTVEEWELGPP